jgi:hypothetical protein
MTAVRRTEISMWARAEEASSHARDAIDEVFSDEGLTQILQVMKEQRR